MADMIPRDAAIEDALMDAVWAALKSDATDLGKQQRILTAVRAIPALEPQPDPRDTALEIWKLANSRDPDDPVFLAAIAALIGEKK